MANRPLSRNHPRSRIDKHVAARCVINFMDTKMRHPIVSQALELLACETRETDLLASPDAVRDYLRLLLGDRPHEIFAVVFLDA
jgi:DNA repair protein RadC